MLEHGYANYVSEISRYDILSMYSLVNDKIKIPNLKERDYGFFERKL